MKKFISILLALVMVLSLSTAAFATGATEVTLTTVEDKAETTDVVENAVTIDVNATTNLISGAHADITYYINVAWTLDGDMVDINLGETYKWNTETLRYELATGDEAESKNKYIDVTITLTNSSNAEVDYTIAYADNGEDKLNTVEATKLDSKAMAIGKLDNADTTTAAAVDNESSFAYTIDDTKVTKVGGAKTAVYTANVSVDSVKEGFDTVTGADVTLGTYTVTLGNAGASAVENKTISEILATVDNFPTAQDNGWKPLEGDERSYKDEGTNALVLGSYSQPLTVSAIKNDSGDYILEAEGSVITFKMSDNKLFLIIYKPVEGDEVFFPRPEAPAAE